MGKTAYLFPGQGAQKAGMGKDFYEHSAAARTFFEEASEQLQMDLKTLCFTDNENLNQTAYTQPAMVTAELAIVEAMKEAGIFCPDAAAGIKPRRVQRTGGGRSFSTHGCSPCGKKPRKAHGRGCSCRRRSNVGGACHEAGDGGRNSWRSWRSLDRQR